MATEGKLTARQQRFVEAYILEENGAKAARAAGYSETSAKVTASRMLTNANVLAAIERARSAKEADRAVRAEKVGLTAEFVLSGLITNYERAMQAEEVVLKDGTRTGEYVYQGSVANRALELLGKHLGLFPDRVISEDPAKQPVDQLRARREELRRKLKLA